MTKRVVHQEYLEAWLRGESVELQWCGQVLFDVFDIDKYDMSLFADNRYMFRITPKTVEVNLTDFYGEYDKITTVNFRESFLEDLIAKYLPRGDLWFTIGFYVLSLVE